ncbi:neurogenic locus notch homolog protein 1-like [Macrosteles quadrilineatus]|uniref:neurogenic locus notch homolog protein 1-like n=1 Tax=Macrosteles quadrilineatus TaxID=74068 RepID=UPI0023E22550|nr:neurogenic locus notch homolog protein 1-like [Macrosteles quadrilineatus]
MTLGNVCAIISLIVCLSSRTLSVEGDSNGRPPQSENGRLTSAVVYVRKTVRQVQGGWCTIPDQLQNGRYSPSRNRCRTGDTTPACQMIPGAYVPPNWVIYFSCNPGYKLNTTKIVAVCFNGNWIPGLAQCETDLCTPNPCGTNARCELEHLSFEERPVCTCIPGYLGDPLSYCRRDECSTDNDCRKDQNCTNYNCVSSCTNQCGVDAVCNARNHVAVCSCPPGYTGRPLTRCYNWDDLEVGQN